MESNRLRLGQCHSRADALHKIHGWAAGARSFSLESIIRYHYSFGKIYLNDFMIDVIYFSKKTEGKYQMFEWNYRENILEKKRKSLIKNNQNRIK